MKVIIVTGSIGSGKTTLSKRMSKELGYEYVDVDKLVRKYKISEGYDKKRKCKVVDIKKLNKVLVDEIKALEKKDIRKKKSNNGKRAIKKKSIKKIKKKKGVIIDSHLSHYLSPKYVDLCIVTKCDLKTLEKRLRKKKYSKDKIRENLDCEIFDVCYNEAIERGHEVKVVRNG